MGKRQRAPRHRRSSSADIRHTFLILCLVALVVVIGSVLVAQVRAADWTGTAISGALIAGLLAVSAYSSAQQHRRR